ncbi:MAG: hypothetical protein WBL55_11100 [Xanthobacteraceae bacterium]
MRRMLRLGGLFVVLCAAMPARAGDFFGFFSAPDPQCYWCIRDAIYADVKLIDHLEANPDVDDAVKGPQIAAARADIYRLRLLLGPLQQVEPCCYSRRPLYIR